MFGNIKKKLSNALQEGFVISESLQQHYRRVSTPSTPVSPTFEDRFNSDRSSLRSSSTTEDLVDAVPSNVNVAAGCNLLAKYEDDWVSINKMSEENARRADQIATEIDKIKQKTMEQRVVMTDLITCLSGIPGLIVKLENSKKTLQDITEFATRVERETDVLQNLCEECEMQEFILQKQFELSQYKQKKMGELEVYRQKVAAEHQGKIRQHEEHLKQIQRERQAVFDDAFRGDIEEFKQKGVITKISTESKAKVTLEEVDLQDEQTKDALEEFLNG
ncbi:dysbindin protein homolog [Teleopsis dalmanni]|uniref:dysbindin protein homolog n=1 Tax=Teleopsis dalmanni TaxID=139649 RepID=UPI000D32CEEC|nr:dysbindin protein homolog [Teleopsis dalmanni]